MSALSRNLFRLARQAAGLEGEPRLAANRTDSVLLTGGRLLGLLVILTLATGVSPVEAGDRAARPERTGGTTIGVDGPGTGSGTGSASQLTFTNITTDSSTGGPATFGGHGVQFADLTGDGLPDLYVTMITNGTDTLPDIFYRNLGGTQFVDEAAARGIDNFDLGSHGAVWADLDEDGDLDLYNGSWEQNRVYRNDGAGSFTDMTAGSGLPARAWKTRGVAALDMDGDGDLDLFAVTGSQGSSAAATERNEIYLNQGGFQFTSVDSGDLFTAPAGQGVTDVDLDNDGDMDLLAANSSGPMNILINNGTGQFSLADPAAYGLGGVTADDAITAADVNNDGYLDLAIDRSLYINQGSGTFAFGQSLGGSGYMGNFADLDNDGDLDAVIAGSGNILMNDGSGAFTEETSFTACGEPVFGCDPRSIAYADIDNDGDLDFFYANKATFNTLIRNNYTGSNRWLKVTPMRASGQRGAFGARVSIYAAGQMGQDAGRIAWREARSQQGYLAQNDPVLHFGVGSAIAVDVRVRFPGGETVDLYAVPTPVNLRVTEPASAPDVTAPDPVTDLAVGAATASTLDLNWTATGDDGATGRATAYDLRRADTPILNDADFLAATPVTGLPSPQTAGAAEQVTVTGLVPLTTYHFALKVSDEAGNTSSLSNTDFGSTTAPPDLTAPDPVTTLSTGGATTSSLDVSWTASGDDGATGQATAYDLRHAPAPILSEADFTAATMVTGLPAPQTAGAAELVTVGGLLDNTTYHFALKVSDEAGNTSSLSNLATGTTLDIPDVTSPDPVADLAVGAATTSSLEISWTATGDDGATGQASSYDLRHAATAILTDADFLAATPVTGLPLPQTAGNPELFTVTGLLPDTTYHFALKVSDEDGNTSGLSNTAMGDTAAPSLILLQEDFSTPLSADWSVVDEGTTSAPSDWQVAGGELTQNSNIYEPDPLDPDLPKLGTYLLYGPGSTWTDVRIGWRQRSEDDDDLGIMLRYVDNDNYYRFSVDLQRGYRRLVKKEAGVFSLLAGDTTTYTLGVDQLIRIEAAGNDIQVFVDDALVFDVVDSSFTTGTMAFYSWGNTGARFDDLLVEQLILVPDETAPDAVTDLAVGTASDTNLDVAWTATGDDGLTGTAFAYDLRHAATPILDDADFLAATTITGLPSPQAAGSEEQVTVTGLLPLTTYHFALKVSDEAGNVATLSNTDFSSTTAPPDLTAPDPVTDLAVGGAGETSLDVSWTATGDDGNTGQATIYDLRYDATPILDDDAFLAATPVSGLPLPQPVSSPELHPVGGLLDGTTYYFALKVADEAGNFSALSNSSSGTTLVIPDVIAPDPVSDLAVVATAATTLDVSWTATGDDGATGQASSYDLRHAATAILTDADFLAATPVTGLPFPQAAGNPEMFTVSGLLPTTTYHFALQVADGAGNQSTLSNTDSGTTAAPSVVLLQEEFTTPLSNDWSVVDEGTTSAPSNWQVAGGELNQNSNIYEPDLIDTDLPKLGTYLLYGPGSAWTDVTIGWRQRSEDDDDLGVMFRYVDNDNYYRFSVDLQRGYRRLVKKEAGVFSLLAGDTTPYTLGVDQIIRIEAAGNDIQVFVDDTLVFDVVDSSFTTGTVAFYSWGNTGARFDDLLVEQLILVPDETSPDPVADLDVGAASDTTLDVTWTATGDDGLSGTAFAYDLRHAVTAILNDADFTAATPVTGLPSPQSAGSPEQVTVTGLLPLTTYHFALKVSDEAGNTSSLSNTDFGSTTAPPDLTAPDPVTDLAVGGAGETSLEVSWTASGDDGATGQATSYDLRYAASAILDDTAFLAATPVTGLPLPQTAGALEQVTVSSLLDGTTYYFALKVADEAGNFSALSNSSSGTTLVIPDVTAPDPVTTLAVGTASSSTLDVSWTATGDDGATGQASSYDLRHAATAILTDADFLAATPVTGLPLPQTAGALEQVTVTALLPDTTYHFALKVADGAGNISALSNTDSGTTTQPSVVLLQEDFSSSLGIGWSVVDEGTNSAPSAWLVAGGELTQNSNIFSDDGANLALPKEGTYLLYTPGSAWDDVSIDWRQRSEDDDGIGLMFRYVDNDNYYRYSVDLTRGFRRLVKKEAGVYTELAGDTTTYIQGVDQAMRVEATGNRLRVLVDGAPVFDVLDSSFPAGSMAFYCWGNTGARFDDLLVQQLILDPDLLNPDPVTDLAVGTATAASIAISWTASGDDGATGQAFSYDLRHAATAILNDADFLAATPVPGLPLPQSAGNLEQFMVSGLSPETTYHFALKVSDEAGNLSPLSNSPQGTTTPFALFLDTFDDPGLPGWSFVDDGGTVGGPGSWSAPGGQMVQTSDIKFLDAATGYPIGTYGVWGAGQALSDYLISASVFSPSDRPDDDRDIGLVFRYQDADNFYRFSMDRARGRRLIARVNGLEETLVADTSTYSLDTTHTIEILARGDRFLIRVDGNSILAAEDSRLITGTAGLYCTYNPGATFDDFLMADLPAEAAMGLTSPSSYAIATGAQMDAAALALDDSLVPAVRFTLDPGPGESVVVDDTPPFSASFPGLATGEHSLLAEIYDPVAALPVSCSRCDDLRETLGMGGTWLTGFGDSILRGEQDFLQVDDRSADDRNNVIGPRPLLNNWLTSWEGRPHTVTGEAYEAFGVREAWLVLPEALVKHPGSATWLVLLGSNDQSARESGVGLTPADPEYSSTYKEWMQTIIDTLVAQGKEIIIGKIPFSNRASANDVRIQEYGTVIDELYAANGIPGTPPDFYSMVAADPATLLSPDGIHLSGEGYRRMGRLFYEAVAERRIGAPPMPAPATVSVEPGGIRLDWATVAGVDGYHVWRRADPAGLFQSLTAGTIPDLTYLDTTATPGITYSYVITAVSGGLEGPFSDEVFQTAP